MIVSHEASRTGAPRVAVDLVKVFAAAGWHTVVVLRWGGPLRTEFESAADVTVSEPLSRVRAVLRRRRITRGLSSAIGRWAARRVVARVRPDLVWCNTVITANYATAAATAGVPSVVHSHEHAEVVRRTLDTSGLGEVLRLAGRPPATPSLVACAPATAKVLAEAASRRADEVQVLYSPVDVAEVREAAAGSAPDGAPRIVAVGLGNRGKGIDVFAAAATLAANDSRSGRWQWVGEVVEPPPAGPVEYLGPRPSAAPVIGSADVFVLPSRADAFPLVVLEAMALGRPVVASDLPGPREQLGDAGVLFPAGDAVALRDAVAELLADPDTAAAMGAAAAERCEQHWDLPAFAERVIEIADRTVER